MKKSDELVAVFKWKSRSGALHRVCETLLIPKRKVQRDATTRVIVRHKQVHVLLPLMQPMTCLFASPPENVKGVVDATPALTPQDCCRLREVEAVLNVLAVFTTVAQAELCVASGIRAVVKCLLLAALRSKQVFVLNEADLKQGKAVQVEVPVNEVSELGKKALARALVEAERVGTVLRRRLAEGGRPRLLRAGHVDRRRRRCVRL